MGKIKIDPGKFMRFGCEVLFHLPKELQRGKFGTHSIPAIYMGLSSDGFSSMIYSSNDNRVISSRTVKCVSGPRRGNADIFIDSEEGLSFDDYFETELEQDVEKYEGKRTVDCLEDNFIDENADVGRSPDVHRHHLQSSGREEITNREKL